MNETVKQTEINKTNIKNMGNPYVMNEGKPMDFDQKVKHYYELRGKQYDHLYTAAAKKYNVDKDILIRQGAQESGFWHPDVVTGRKRSSAGAIGIAQFMPATAKHYGIDPRDPAQSIDAQGKYMRRLLDMFDGDYRKALAGYNWGQGNVQRKGINVLPKETAKYISAILSGVGVATTLAIPAGASAKAAIDTVTDDPLGFKDLTIRIFITIFGVVLFGAGVYLKGAAQ